MPKFTHLPTEIEAFQFHDASTEFPPLFAAAITDRAAWPLQLTVATPGGPRTCGVGDWLVNYGDGSVYPVANDAFLANYEPVEHAHVEPAYDTPPPMAPFVAPPGTVLLATDDATAATASAILAAEPGDTVELTGAAPPAFAWKDVAEFTGTIPEFTAEHAPASI